MSFRELLGNVGVFGGAVMACLALLSIISVGVVVDKFRRFQLAARQTQIFKRKFGEFLHGGDIQSLIEASNMHQNSHVAQVVSAAINEYEGVRQKGADPVASLELVTSALEDSTAETLLAMKRGLGFLATIGSTAPFIGLFGTVVGIINAFRSIASAGAGGMAVVSGGMAEALVSTGLGIFVAIPAVVAYNQFTGNLENFRVEMNRASSQLVNHLFKVPELMAREAPIPESEIVVREGAYARR
jgi:biopolymer transport protein ExbB/biopolymer transport protein TolQ